MPVIQVQPIINYDAKKWCSLKYPDHPKGCPNVAKGCLKNIGFFDKIYDMTKPIYAVYTTFNVGKHAKKMKNKHPNWTERQCYNLLYWQGSARKNFRPIVKEFLEKHKDYEACYKPEGMGVDVTQTMAKVGIKLDWPPKNITYLIVFAGVKNKNTKDKEAVILI